MNEVHSYHSEEQPEKLDLANAQVVSDILAKGDPSELAMLQSFHHLTPEQITLFVSFARLRNDVHIKMYDEEKTRKENNPKATEEELNMGIYTEYLEPQVREAVVLLRKKGYPTNESGFYGPPDSIQKIGFEVDCLKDFNFSQDFVDELAKKGVALKKTNNSIEFTLDHYSKIEEIKAVWDEIALLLPDQGRPAPETKLLGAKDFREKQKKLK